MLPYLVVEDLFWYVLILFIKGCSADTCDFGVLVRGGKLRVFRLRHLAGLSYIIFFFFSKLDVVFLLKTIIVSLPQSTYVQHNLCV